MQLADLLRQDPIIWIHGAQTAIAVAWWIGGIVGVLEWRDRHGDQARARQHKWRRWRYLKTDAIAAIPATWIRSVGLAGAVGIVLVALNWPAATYTVSVALIVRGIRGMTVEPDEIAELRAALSQIIGIDDAGRPPKIRTEGRHNLGGPMRVIIHPHPGWPHWEKTKQNKVERAIEATTDGDWTLVEWRNDGTNVWERLPELPDRADYTAHLPDLEWYELPVGPDGSDGIAVADLSEHPHWFVAGSTGGGKTTWLRAAIAHLLHHISIGTNLVVVAVDIAYAGLAFAEGRPGVVSAMESFEQIQQTIANLRQELKDRHAQLREDRSYRPPMVVIVDELEELCDQARTYGTKTAGAPEPQLILDLLAIGRTGRKVDMHLILATQRPAGDAIPTSLRANCKGRIAFGSMDRHSAEMILEKDWVRAVNCPNIKGRAVVRCGDRIGSAQGWWLADPDEPKHNDADRARASALLPARLHTINQQASAHAPAHAVATTAIAVDQPAARDSTTDLDKRRDVGGVSSGVGGGGSVEIGVSEAEMSAREELARRRRQKAAIQRRYIAKAKKEILSNPMDPRHGSPIARQVGCTCPMDRPELHADTVRTVSRSVEES